MTPHSRYPNFNDPPHDRPVLSMARTLSGELVWLLIPVAVIALGLMLR